MSSQYIVTHWQFTSELACLLVLMVSAGMLSCSLSTSLPTSQINLSFVNTEESSDDEHSKCPRLPHVSSLGQCLLWRGAHQNCIFLLRSTAFLCSPGMLCFLQMVTPFSKVSSCAPRVTAVFAVEGAVLISSLPFQWEKALQVRTADHLWDPLTYCL